MSTQNVPVPVPVYCRPLMEKEPGMKVVFIVIMIIGQSHIVNIVRFGVPLE